MSCCSSFSVGERCHVPLCVLFSCRFVKNHARVLCVCVVMFPLCAQPFVHCGVSASPRGDVIVALRCDVSICSRCHVSACVRGHLRVFVVMCVCLRGWSFACLCMRQFVRLCGLSFVFQSSKSTSDKSKISQSSYFRILLASFCISLG